MKRVKLQELGQKWYLGVIPSGSSIATGTVVRATSAFRKVTKCNTYDEYISIVKEQYTKLKLAQKYANGEKITEDDIKNVADSVDKSTKQVEELEEKAIAAEMQTREDPDKDTVFSMPKNKTTVASKGTSDMIEDADAFINDENATNYIKAENLQSFSQSIYRPLLGVGIVLAIIIGAILGIKFMLASVGQKAEIKKLFIPYVVGCVLVFGAFGIWKIVVTILAGI